jgi:hypothetical protein
MTVGTLRCWRGGLWALALGVCLCGAGPLPATPLVETEVEAPRTHVRNPVVDLGVVAVGTDARARFELENRGNGDLEILGAHAGCACTLAEFDETIPPGQVGYIRASLDTKRLSGSVTKGIVVRTNDPEHSRFTLTVKAHVVGSVKLLPQPVIYIRKREGQSPVGRVLIRKEQSERGTLAVRDVRTSVPWLTASVERLEVPRPRGQGLPDGRVGDWVLEVRFSDDRTRFGLMKGNVHFGTGLSRQPNVSLDVESNLEPPIHLSTERLLLAPSLEGRARGTLFASVSKGFDPATLDVEFDPSGLEVKLEPATERMFRVEVTWPGGRLDGGFVTFRIGKDSVRIPVEWSGR